MRRIVLPMLLMLLMLAGCQSVNGPATVPTSAHASSPTPLVRGRALILERIAPPVGATLDVQLIDDDLADGAALSGNATIARMRWTALPGPPFAFELPYDPARAPDDHHYSLRATLRDSRGRLEYSTAARVAVVPGAPDVVEFRLVRIVD